MDIMVWLLGLALFDVEQEGEEEEEEETNGQS